MFLSFNYKEVACKEVMFCVIRPGSFVFIFESVTADQNYIQVKINETTIFFVSKP